MKLHIVLAILATLNPVLLIGQTYRDSIIDIHAHFWQMEKSADEYVKDNKDLNIRTGGIVIIQKPGHPVKARETNDRLIDLCKSSERFFPVCSVHPYDGDSAIFELRRLKQLGVKMIKLHPISQEFDIEDVSVFNLVREAGNLGIVVLIDAYTFFQQNNIEKLITSHTVIAARNLYCPISEGPNSRSLSFLEAFEKRILVCGQYVVRHFRNNKYFRWLSVQGRT